MAEVVRKKITASSLRRAGLSTIVDKSMVYEIAVLAGVGNFEEAFETLKKVCANDIVRVLANQDSMNFIDFGIALNKSLRMERMHCKCRRKPDGRYEFVFFNEGEKEEIAHLIVS